MTKLRLLLVDDHQLFTDALAALLHCYPAFKVVAVSNSPMQAIALAGEYKPDIIFTDISMSPIDGIELTKQIILQMPEAKIIALSSYNVFAYAKKMISAGALGYVTKDSSKEELVEAIYSVYRGQRYICNAIKEKISNEQLETDTLSVRVALNKLTKRELDVIAYMKEGFFSKEIGDKLGVNTKTIEAHRYNIFRKLGMRNAAELINLMSANGL